jgi:hypothetical protein
MSAAWRSLGVASAKGPLEGQSTKEVKDNIQWDVSESMDMRLCGGEADFGLVDNLPFFEADFVAAYFVPCHLQQCGADWAHCEGSGVLPRSVEAT